MEKRRPHWDRLEQLVLRAGKGLAALNSRELQELGLLYRQTASDLSVVTEDKTSVQLAAYLNQLLGRSHNLLYSGRRPKTSGILTFYSKTYPRLFRQALRPILLATAIFAAATLAGWVVTIHDPGFAYRLLPSEVMDTIERRQMWTHSVVAMKPVADFCDHHQQSRGRVHALSRWASPASGPIWMMLFNGLMLGVAGAATWHAGMAISFWSFVAPHGVLELPAVFIAGGGGLELARGLFFPGLLPRRESLARAGGRAARLLLGSIPILLVAGAIEGFFSPSNSPVAMKFALAAVLFSALLSWLLSRGKTPTTDYGL